MTRRSSRDPHTLSLLEWQPPEPVKKFAQSEVRAASLDARICKAIVVALRDAGAAREVIAARMSAYLGETVSLAMLNAYASPARSTHTINVVRFVALVHATHDRRLLELLAEMFGWSVVDERYADAIAEVELAEKAEEISRQLQLTRMKRRSGGR